MRPTARFLTAGLVSGVHGAWVLRLALTHPPLVWGSPQQLHKSMEAAMKANRQWGGKIPPTAKRGKRHSFCDCWDGEAVPWTTESSDRCSYSRAHGSTRRCIRNSPLYEIKTSIRLVKCHISVLGTPVRLSTISAVAQFLPVICIGRSEQKSR